MQRAIKCDPYKGKTRSQKLLVKGTVCLTNRQKPEISHCNDAQIT